MIYFIQEESDRGLIKIGVTGKNIMTRLAGLQTGSPDTLKVLGVIEGDSDLETKLHSRFDYARYRAEWFYPVKELVNFVESNRVMQPVRQDISMAVALPGAETQSIEPPVESQQKIIIIVDSTGKKPIPIDGMHPTEALTPKMARQAAFVAIGYGSGVTVWDSEYGHGYRVYQNSARKLWQAE